MRGSCIIGALAAGAVGLQIANAGLVYDHESLIGIAETITDIGGGQWLYEYEIVSNNETNGIWHFLLYTSFATDGTTSFVVGGWAADVSTDLDDVFPTYDARNIDAALTHMTNTWGPGTFGDSSNPLAAGATTTGFSFIADVFDPNPKLYAYELQGGYAAETGLVSAIGYTFTLPAPGALMLLGLAGLVTRTRGR